MRARTKWLIAWGIVELAWLAGQIIWPMPGLWTWSVTVVLYVILAIIVLRRHLPKS